MQAELEAAISQLDPHRPIQTFAAGRTDTGVHAAGQVVHFDCSTRIPPKWAPALNGRLPASVRVRESVLRPSEWHACYSASYRRYRYTIYNARRPNLFLSPWSWHRYHHRLDESRMRDALNSMLGLHDFTAFMRAGSRRAHARTTVQDVLVKRSGDLITVEIQASGFLYGMVRLLMAQLVAVGEHRLSVAGFEQRWRERRRDMKSRKRLPLTVYACCARAIPRPSSPRLAGTIANRGFFWQRVIHLRILRHCRKQTASISENCFSFKGNPAEE